MQVMPTAEGEIGSVATVTYSAQASVKARCTMPQLAIRMTAPDQPLGIGQRRLEHVEPLLAARPARVLGPVDDALVVRRGAPARHLGGAVGDEPDRRVVAMAVDRA